MLRCVMRNLCDVNYLLFNNCIVWIKLFGLREHRSICSAADAIQSSPILSLSHRDFAHKNGPTPRIESHFLGSKPLQIITKLRPMVV